MRTTFLLKILLLTLVLSFQMNQASCWGFFRRIVRSITKAVKAVVTVVKNYNNSGSYMDGHQCHVTGSSYGSCNVRRSGMNIQMTKVGDVPLVNLIDFSVINHALLKKRYVIRWYDANKSVQTMEFYQISASLYYTFKNNIINATHAYKNNYRSWARELIRLFGVFEGQQRSQQNAERLVNHQRINSLNHSINNAANEVNLRNAKKQNLKITTNENNIQAGQIKDKVAQNAVKVSNCKAQSDAVQGTIALYQKYRTEFTEEKSYNFLALEQSNLCTFHVHADDLILLIPTEMNTLNKERAFLVRNRRADTVKQLLNGQPYYIYDRELQGDESEENQQDVIDEDEEVSPDSDEETKNEL